MSGQGDNEDGTGEVAEVGVYMWRFSPSLFIADFVIGVEGDGGIESCNCFANSNSCGDGNG